MNTWQYTAIRLADRCPMQGELGGESAADVRGQLRRIGLQVIKLRAAEPARTGVPGERAWHLALGMPLAAMWRRHVRQRRRMLRAEFFDSLATMINAGLPLLAAVETIMESMGGAGRPRARRSMLATVRERLRGGDSFAEALREHPTWFDGVEIAMIEAGQHGGTLCEVLLRLAQRHARLGGLQQKLVGALTYPAVVSMVGLGVTVFLSIKTLPQLTQILIDADIPVPGLTTHVMALGGFIANYWWAILLVSALLAIAVLIIASTSFVQGAALPRPLRTLWPQLLVVRRLRLASAVRQLSDLLRSGVPMVEALRVLAPAGRGAAAFQYGPGNLNNALRVAADRLERGDDLAEAFDRGVDRGGHWFDAEFRQLLTIGQASGTLEELLLRIAERYERQSQRLIDRLTSVLEPTVIMFLALGVGTVVMAAILPLLRLQEIL